MANIINQYGQVKVGVRVQSSGSGGGGIDADAQAFITAASITDTTQQSAINTLVTQLKTYGIWTKMKALYPFVGGTASSHKWNLKDPRDLDAAYRLVFNGGWTHSSTGAQPNGTTGYADTKLTPSSVLSLNSTHLSVYSRTNSSIAKIDMGVYTTTGVYAVIRNTDGKTYFRVNRNAGYSEASYALSTSALFYMINRPSSTSEKLHLNGATINFGDPSFALANQNIYIGALNDNNTASGYSSREYAFSSIGDGLSDAEATAFYNAVQTFQSTLGRQIGVPIVADTDAQAFLNAAVITDSTQASAIDTLVTDLKSANIWTKMKALYPFVGGTATAHKFNLKDPRDLDAAYRLVFNGGWTHSSTGAKPNGTTGWATTYFNPVTQLTTPSSNHLATYLRTNIDEFSVDMGSFQELGNPYDIESRISNVSYIFNGIPGTYISFSTTDSRGFYVNTRQSSTLHKVFVSNVLKGSNTSTFQLLPNANIAIGARFNVTTGTTYAYSSKEQAFASIGDGLTDAEAAAFYTAVQKYQTSLGRQV
jgi:hypothetical protein